MPPVIWTDVTYILAAFLVMSVLTTFVYFAWLHSGWRQEGTPCFD